MTFQTDTVLLATITIDSSYPLRRFYCRCWGCGKRRFAAQWWEGYQLSAPEFRQPNDEYRYWGYFCAYCTTIIASIQADHERYNRDEVRIETLKEVLADIKPNDVGDFVRFQIERKIYLIQREQRHSADDDLYDDDDYCGY